MENEEQEFLRVRIVACGSRSVLKSLILNFGVYEFNLANLRFRPILLLKYLAESELNFASSTSSFGQQKYSHVHMFKKMIGFGKYTKSFTKGILSGFEVTLDIEINHARQAPRLTDLSNKVWISRFSGRHGLILDTYEDEIEYNVRRFFHQYKLFILQVDLIPSAVSKSLGINFSRRKLDQAIDAISASRNGSEAPEFLNCFPSWHYAKSYAQLLNFDFNPNYENKVLPYRYLEIPGQSIKTISNSPSSSIFKLFTAEKAQILNGKNLVIDNTLIFLSDSAGPTLGKWPSSAWSVQGSTKSAIPNISIAIQEFDKATFAIGSTNWHHFVEDVLPPLSMIERKDLGDVLLMGGKGDSVQNDLITGLLDLSITRLASDSKAIVNHLTFSQHSNSRNLVILGDSSGISADVNLMSNIVNRFNDRILKSDSQQEDLFILRKRGLFRPMVNQRKLRRSLISKGFREIDLDYHSFKQRLEIFASARSIVIETGAAQANLYFSKFARILELRPPTMRQTNEHVVIQEATHSEYNIIVGSNLNVIRKFFGKSDSWKVDIKKVESWLTNT